MTPLHSEGFDREIVLVDDNPQDAELTMRALRSRASGVQLRWARDGLEALELLTAEDAGNLRPRVVLLDLKMPRIDGHEVLRRLKADPRTQTIPVVILSSSAERSDVLRAYQGGANSYVVKPVGYEKFREAIADLGAYWLGLNHPSCAEAGPDRGG